MASISKSVTSLIPKNGPPLPGWVLPLLARFLYGGKRASRLDGALSIPMFRRWGTTTGNQLCVVNGDAPVKNWAGSGKEKGARGFNPDSMLKRSLKRYQCSACPLGCGAILKGVGGYAETHRPEYETSNSFGPLLLNDDLESVILLNEIMNRAGLDTISVGAVLAFAIECFENGLLTEEDTGGLKLTWGNSQAIVEMAKKIAARDGLGDVLADGVVVAAKKIGKGAEQFAVHAGGEELPMHDPKFDTGYGVHYISDPTPGRHTIGANSTYETLRLWTKVKWAKEAPASYAVNERYEANAERGEWAAACSMAKMVIDGAGVCNFGLMLGVDRYPLFDYLNAATGWQKTPEEYMEIGRRVQTLRQAFNVREGVMPKDVRMHGRAYGDPPLQSGATRGRKFDVYAARRFYWEALGWDGESGVPLPETLSRLGITIV